MTRAYRLTRPEPSESAVLDAILQALAVHPAVGGFWRQNTGAFAIGEGRNRRFVRFGPKGSPDIHGYLNDGRALFVEVKRPSGRVSGDQKAFIERAVAHGAVAFVARSVDDVWDKLTETSGKSR
jgi:predicted NUDIX family NTP pyrophosphohydrolase